MENLGKITSLQSLRADKVGEVTPPRAPHSVRGTIHSQTFGTTYISTSPPAKVYLQPQEQLSLGLFRPGSQVNNWRCSQDLVANRTDVLPGQAA
jgi:hypothetical protein